MIGIALSSSKISRYFLLNIILFKILFVEKDALARYLETRLKEYLNFL